MVTYEYDKNSGITTCTITDKQKTYIGYAQLHPDDVEWENELGGRNIARIRATIKMFQDYKNNEIKPALSALKQLYYSMNRSKNFNENSYENTMLQRQIRLYEFDLEFANKTIAELRKNLHDYIQEKDEFHEKVKRNRAVKESQHIGSES